MDLFSIPIHTTRLLVGDDFYVGEGGRIIFASAVGTAKLLYPKKPHDQIDELNRFQHKEIDRRFDRLAQDIQTRYY